MEKRLLIKGHNKNPLVKFWNWGWNIYYKNIELWNYVIVGLLTTIVSFIAYFGITRFILTSGTSLDILIANVISWVCAVIFAYITNRIFVFKSKNKKIISEFLNFTGSRIISLLMDVFCMWLIVNVLLFSDVLGKIVSQVVVTIANYVLSKLFVFNRK